MIILATKIHATANSDILIRTMNKTPTRQDP